MKYAIGDVIWFIDHKVLGVILNTSSYTLSGMEYRMYIFEYERNTKAPSWMLVDVADRLVTIRLATPIEKVLYLKI